MALIIVSLVAMLLLVFFARGRDTAQARVETLLLNVLPADIAQRLQSDPNSIADHFDGSAIPGAGPPPSRLQDLKAP